MLIKQNSFSYDCLPVKSSNLHSKNISDYYAWIINQNLDFFPKCCPNWLYLATSKYQRSPSVHPLSEMSLFSFVPPPLNQASLLLAAESQKQKVWKWQPTDPKVEKTLTEHFYHWLSACLYVGMSVHMSVCTSISMCVCVLTLTVCGVCAQCGYIPGASFIRRINVEWVAALSKTWQYTRKLVIWTIIYSCAPSAVINLKYCKWLCSCVGNQFYFPSKQAISTICTEHFSQTGVTKCFLVVYELQQLK